ncbi:MAG: hypothetical protein JAZ18_12235 [Candidatus Thiodiazotropha endolucinida]|nr:hypothetical protein [Candidatus Thiodiazotropha sp. (ex Codakia orbicularis)]MBT3056479.1 hypothetical protein [Candidatus Thiodiazotropha sp. (ex Codakia orbicularis)]MCG7863150.1 hypothetical protein [Candidatus Thiodiazotropha endolucinida]
MRALNGEYSVWAVESETNRKVAEIVWEEDASDYAYEFGITTFKVTEGESEEEMFLRILRTVDDHHNDHCEAATWTNLLVFGLKPSTSVKGALNEYGVDKYNEFQGGFECERTLSSAA